MSNFPTSLDDDGSIYRVDDNLSQIGSEVINQLRSAIFAVEQNIGLSAAGSLGSLSDRLNVSLNANGTIKASALTSIGLVTLPITNTQVGTNAGILESKLSLDYSTADLNTLIQANTTLLNSLAAYEAALETKVNSHISGGPASNLRHTASMIDINGVPSDSRDPSYTWVGLIDKDGYDLSAATVADALYEINTNLTNHQNQAIGAHEASAISVDTSGFHELLSSSNNVQTALQNIDNIELLQLGTHREVHHSNGVPNRALALNLNSLTTIGSDGYNISVVSSTPVTTHIAHSPPGTSPVDNVTNGDSIVAFSPVSNANAIFDAQFSQVKVGDIIRINYGIGIEDLRRVESIKYVPGSIWTVRINGVNLRDTDGYTVYARIDRPLYDTNVTGVLAVAAANAVPLDNYSILGSVIVGDPRGANALGINFNPSKITKNNYNLYLQLYPSGNPSDHVINLPAIDVSGDAGVSAGKYTLESTVQSVNNAFRKTGYNYRFIAYAHEGNFGISLADSIDGASFAIISGSNSTGSLTESSFTNNVIGDVYGLGFDALGLGLNNANIASPAFQSSWLDATAAQIPTKVIHPVKSRNYIVNGRPFDTFKPKPLTTNGFWVAEIESRTSVGSSIEVTYKINKILDTAGLKAGKTIVVQPAVDYSDGLYNDVDYGRFIIKEVIFNPCECLDEYTLITVISGIHGTGNSLSSSSAAGLPVRLYFGEDSVSFDDQNIIDISEVGTNYHRLFEIYITDAKTTFSHERARMPYQIASGNLITSNYFHIDSVSPKFRGYKDNSSNLNKYIRFYVLNYNIDTGEYDGYLGQRNSLDYTISKTGPVVRARKNVKARFYDDTNVDFIDITFIDESTSFPGITITSSPAYVDIELFDTLELDGEILLLATCEVNWNQDVGKNVVYKVKDRKQHGSISEYEFTESARKYIAAGERYLHGNGVIKGFEIDSSGKINGGLALVNGKFAISNPTTINIPLCTNLTAPPQTLNWILCVNENGNLILLPLTTTKSEFFARDGYSGSIYYLESVSFNELINRKDLTPLYIYNVTVSDIPTVIINSISDVRKYVKDETSLIPLVWSGKAPNDLDLFNSTSEITGHFHTIEQVISWINWTKLPSNIVKVKGNLIFENSLDLRTLAYPTVFDGIEGGTITSKTGRGILLFSNVHIINMNFNWILPGLSYVANDNVNLDQSNTGSFSASNGFIYVYHDIVETVISNIVISNCKFTGTFPQTQRPPYISFILASQFCVFDNIKITDNIFSDVTTNQCAIAMVAIYYGEGYRELKNVFIENNISDRSTNTIDTNFGQSIIISESSYLSINFAPFICSNVNVTRNKMGAIGYLINTSTGSPYENDNGLISNGLNIINNFATFIGTLDTTGYLPNENLYSNSVYGTGDVVIKNNYCSSITCNFYPCVSFSLNIGQSLLISENNLKTAINNQYISNAYGLGNVFTAINVRGWANRSAQIGSFSLINDTRVALILNNIISYSQYSAIVSSYDVAINTESCGGIVSGNIIRGFNNIGISGYDNVYRDKPVKLDIINNQLYNLIDTANFYINVGKNTPDNSIFFTIFNNSFDKIQTNGSVDNMIASTDNYSSSIIKNNVNQTAYAYLRAMDVGKIVFDAGACYDPNFNNSPFVGPSSVAYYSTGSTITGTLSQLTAVLPSTGTGFSWVIPLNIVNNDGKFVSAKVFYTQFGDPGNSNDITLRLKNSTYFSETLPVSGNDLIAVTATKTVTDNARSFIEINAPAGVPYVLGAGLVLELIFAVGTGTNTRKICFEPIKYTFRY